MSMYHTDLRPKDRQGEAISPLDIVIIEEVPQHYWADPLFASLKLYSGCYGLITYAEQEAGEYLPYYMEDKSHPGWVSGDGSVVHVLSRRTEGNAILSWDFWVPPKALRKIPYDCLVMNIFVEYPWQMRNESGPGSTLFVRDGMPEFDYLSKVMKTPYDLLVRAHDAAMGIALQGDRS